MTRWSLVLLVCVALSCGDRPAHTSDERELHEPRTAGQSDSTRLSVSVIATNLDVPWDIVWGPDNWIWYTEQSGSITKVNPVTGERKLLLRVMPEVYRWGTRGLLCIALHPDFENSPYVVVNYHYMRDRYVKDIWSRWVRYTYDGETLKDPLILFEETAEAGHNGSRATFASDGTIFIANGDGDNNNDELNSGVAQDMKKFGGKVLRYNLDGTIPHDNPFPGSPVWALGFRVPQGIVWGPNGNLYTAEHGHNNDDEINLVIKGGNYGYPHVSGICDKPRELEFCAKQKVEPPIKAWTPTVAPSGMDYYSHQAIPEWNNSLLVVTLKTQSLRVLSLNPKGDSVIKERVYFEGMFGRIRDVCVAPDGDVYISTSNRDWNPVTGFPRDKDDRILRISATHRGDVTGQYGGSAIELFEPKKSDTSPGAVAYRNYCASCHKDDGNGVPGTFPALSGSPIVNAKDELIGTILNGRSTGTFETTMPAFGFLSDDELARIVTYVQHRFAGTSGETKSSDIAARRKAK